MDEYSRILIEEYCLTHNSAKSRRLQRLINKSYDLSYELTNSEAIFLEKCIEDCKEPDLKEALQDLDQFMCGF